MARRNTAVKAGKRFEEEAPINKGAKEALVDRKRKERIDRLLTVEEAAKFLRCSKSALNKWRGTGAGPRFVYVGNRIRYRTGEILAFLDRQTRTSTSASEAPAASTSASEAPAA